MPRKHMMNSAFTDLRLLLLWVSIYFGIQHSTSVLSILKILEKMMVIFEETEIVQIWAHARFNPYLWVMILEFSLLPLVICHCAVFIIADITLFTIFGLNPITWLFFIFKEEQSCLMVFANDSSPILGRSLYNGFVRTVQRPNHFLTHFIPMCIIIIIIV